MGDGAVQSAWEAAHTYAADCRVAFAEWRKAHERRVKDSGLSKSDFAKARQVSREHNLERYKVSVLVGMLAFRFVLIALQNALGTVGDRADLNVVVDENWDNHFRRDGRANNAERRWYYYGVDVPDVSTVPEGPFRPLATPTRSPTKRVRPTVEAPPAEGSRESLDRMEEDSPSPNF